MPEESTTPDLVELTRQSFDALNSGGLLGVYISPEVVLDTAGYGMGTFNGREAAVGFLEEWTSSFEDLTIAPDEVLDFGNGVVYTVYRQEGRLAGTSGLLGERYAFVFELVDRVAVRLTNYTDIDEARAAAERLAEERG